MKKMAHNFGLLKPWFQIVFRCYLWIENKVNTEIRINTKVKPVEFGFNLTYPSI